MKSPWVRPVQDFNITTNIQGLEDAIGVSVVHPTWQKTKPDDPSDEHYGWTFASPDDAPFKSPNGTGLFSKRPHLQVSSETRLV